MSKPHTKLDWQVLDEQANDTATVAPKLDSTRASPRFHRIFWIVGCVALLLLLSGAWLWHRAQMGLSQVDTEIYNATQSELWIATQSDNKQLSELAFDPTAAQWHDQFIREDSALSALQAIAPRVPLAVDVRLLDIGRDSAVVELTAAISSTDSTINTFRQKRFYHRAAAGWLRTAPPAAHWGEEASLESAYFVFVFRQHDAAVVAEVASQVDALYVHLHQNFGLPLERETEKSIIEISPTELPGAALLREHAVGHYRIASPDLYLAPESVTDAELVMQSLALLFTAAIVDDASTYYEMYWVRERMQNALRLWALWDLDLPLSAWQQTVKQWPLAGTLNSGDVADLCAIYGVWLPTPSLLSLPLMCSAPTQSTIAAAPPTAISPAWLEQLSTDIFWQETVSLAGNNWIDHQHDIVLLETLVEYVVQRYGRDRLPEFLASLGSHKSWATLTPELFGQSPTEFAMDWRDYLLAHYGVDGTH